jgi:hypothetical protein
VIAWGDGTCGESGTDIDTLVVEPTPAGGYAVANANASAGYTMAAAVGCDDTSCAMLATEKIFGLVPADYALELASGQITGHLRVTVPYVSDDPRDPQPCWQVATVTGAVDRP